MIRTVGVSSVAVAPAGKAAVAAEGWTDIGHVLASDIEMGTDRAPAGWPPLGSRTVEVALPLRAFRMLKPTHAQCLQTAEAIEASR